MAWGRKTAGAESSPAEIDNVIGPATVVRGDLKGERGFRIDGKIEGSVDSEGAVVLGETGSVHGNVTGTDVVIVGRVEGNVTARGHLDIGATGRVVGDVTATSMRIETGGVLRGTSFMGTEEGAEAAEPETAAPAEATTN
jgi:cytoskeletal protein CcmA (bactofilin family)